MKKLMNLKGVRVLNRMELLSGKGAGAAVCSPCAGKSDGDPCKINCHWACPGECHLVGGGMQCIGL